MTDDFASGWGRGHENTPPEPEPEPEPEPRAAAEAPPPDLRLPGEFPLRWTNGKVQYIPPGERR